VNPCAAERPGPPSLARRIFHTSQRPTPNCKALPDRIDLDAAPDKVWALIGDFGASWHPLIANIKLIGDGIGQLRVIETIDGKQIVERLEAIDNSARSYRYTCISGIPRRTIRQGSRSSRTVPEVLSNGVRNISRRVKVMLW
jgi:hypothetical protein